MEAHTPRCPRRLGLDWLLTRYRKGNAPWRRRDGILVRHGLADALAVVGDTGRGEGKWWGDGLRGGGVDTRGFLRGAGTVAEGSGLKLEGALGAVGAGALLCGEEGSGGVGSAVDGIGSRGLRVHGRVVGGQWVVILGVAELGEPDLVADLVAEIHGLPELALGGNAVEDEGVETYGQELGTNLDEGTENNPVDLLADKTVVDIVLEVDSALVVLARPAPEIPSGAFLLFLVEHAGDGGPHCDCDDEGEDSHDSPVDCEFLGSIMPSSPVCE